MVRISNLLARATHFQQVATDSRAHAIEDGLKRILDLVHDPEQTKWNLVEYVDEIFSNLKKTLETRVTSPNKSERGISTPEKSNFSEIEVKKGGDSQPQSQPHESHEEKKEPASSEPIKEIEATKKS